MRSWGPDQFERFVRSTRQPRTELERLDRQLREAGWEDYQLEDLELANALLRQAGDLLLRVARRLRERPREGA